ncbi:hypothetical protein JG688_00007068 [Phytophthora aleatoria]|uniref:HAT C-terminal dimerisation domain-containing protein n=1 Tax=Phytophthora aleatoria TaxID=2496075 RepID=A0A8J5M5F9_9STRA|nr:hypothetical protein JG688_00007068 [Phytophthora aleatoria]
MRNREGKSVWNVEHLCQRIDGCKWFAESGDKIFPSIAKLARVWLGRSSSTAFQECFFSNGSYTMNSLRIHTDNECVHSAYAIIELTCEIVQTRVKVRFSTNT